MSVFTSSPSQRWFALAAGFLGWMGAGLEIASFQLLARPAVLDLSAGATERDVQQWMSWQQAAFLFGAAVGGWLFGWLGDRVGRAKALAWAMLTYSLAAGMGYFATTPEQLLVVRFVSCLGVGGTWPTAVSLVAESWPDVSRWLLSGVLGTAANFGFVLLGAIGSLHWATRDSWRWVLLVAAAPAVVGFLTMALVRDPPRWLQRGKATAGTRNSIREVLLPPFLRRTIVGIVLGAVPVLGTAVNVVWIVPWTDHVASHGHSATAGNKDAPISPRPSKSSVNVEDDDDGALSWRERFDDPRAKSARAIMARSSGAAVGSLFGGALASLLGRRVTYFLISLASLAVSGYLFGFLTPAMPEFGWFNFALGLVGVTYFGWLPLYLPELYPTRIRSTGAGVTFNSGRAVAAVASLILGWVLLTSDDLDYARIGLWTSCVYAIGLIAILFAPDTSKKGLED